MAKSIALWRRNGEEMAKKWRRNGEEMAKKWRSQSRFGEKESLFGEIESRFGEENGEVNRALTKKMAKSIALWRRKW
jgi:hypothetical protein